MTDETTTPRRHYPCVEIAALGDGFVGFTARRSGKPFDFTYWVDGPDSESVNHRIEVFCAENLSPVAELGEDYSVAQPGEPRVLCDPLSICWECDTPIQRWEYENSERIRERGLPGSSKRFLLCSERCEDIFCAEYDPNEPPDVMGAAKGE